MTFVKKINVMSSSLPLCPEGCEAPPAPMQFSNCTPEINVGPIEYIYIGQLGQIFNDWTQTSEWTSRINNTTTNPDDLRQLRVIAEKPEPEGTEVLISGGRRWTGPKTHTITGEIDETNDVNYAALRQYECGGNYSFWYETSNNNGNTSHVFGDNDGIEAYIKMDFIIPKEENGVQKIMFTITWTSKYTPSRIVSPINH